MQTIVQNPVIERAAHADCHERYVGPAVCSKTKPPIE
jgi:hypothetical protein